MRKYECFGCGMEDEFHDRNEAESSGWKQGEDDEWYCDVCAVDEFIATGNKSFVDDYYENDDEDEFETLTGVKGIKGLTGL